MQRLLHLPPCPGFSDMVIESGLEAFQKLEQPDKSIVLRQIELIQQLIPQFGEKSALELITALGIHLVQKEAAAVAAATARRTS